MPESLKRFGIPVEMFHSVRDNEVPLAEAFQEQLHTSLGWRSYQHPDRIKEGLAIVSDAPIWSGAAERLNASAGHHDAVSVRVLRDRLLAIVGRRNQIAHEADLDHTTGRRRTIAPEEAVDTIDWLRSIVLALLEVLDPDGHRSGRSFLLMVGGCRWVRLMLEENRIHPSIAVEGLSMAGGGDTLYLMTTRNCLGGSDPLGHPDREKPLVFGVATASGPLLPQSGVPSKANLDDGKFCALRIKALMPFGAGVDPEPFLSPETVSEMWSFKFKHPLLIAIDSAEARTLQAELAQSLAAPEDHLNEYSHQG